MMQKYLFLDRDGTLMMEPEDKQIDCVKKITLVPHVIPSLLQLQSAGYRLVIITNQDGLGTDSFPQENFYTAHHFFLRLLKSQGIAFDGVKICPHSLQDNCVCRKPQTSLLLSYFLQGLVDKNHSYMIGDRETDMQLGDLLGIRGLRVDPADENSWLNITREILSKERTAVIHRKSTETEINCYVNLDYPGFKKINTGIHFFDHMLEQLCSHAGFGLQLTVQGDLHVDDHHTVEDVAIVLGEALRVALGDKRGIGRYGFVLPMDDALAHVAIDLCNRSFLQFDGSFSRAQVSDFSTEMVKHFFYSFSSSLKTVMHIKFHGENTHHMIEAIFKAVGRCLRQAIQIIDQQLPTTKGLL